MVPIAPFEKRDVAPRIRSQQNIAALLLVVLLAATGIWLIVQLRDSLRTEICIESGRRHCAPLEPPK